MKNIGHHACLREKEHLFRYRAYFEGNLLRFVRARAHVRALIKRISCAVGMRNAKLRNHLKGPVIRATFFFNLSCNMVAVQVETLLHVLPPAWPTRLATKYHVAS